ncbi:MAG: TIGR01777 family oxidoreductase [Candidatus Tyrphobacter sp.]
MRRIAITGASGFIGQRLSALLRERGYEPVPISIRPESLRAGALKPSLFDDVEAVIHLAGESVAARWTPEKRRAIEDSRRLGTLALVEALRGCATAPRVLVSASASGYYGSRGDEALDETAAPGSDFLARVCVAWEREAMAAASLMRVAILRTGMVLGDGGALARMRVPFTAGLGGPFGSGRQFVPWIHLDDLCELYLFAAQNTGVAGPINAVAPDYATCARFAQALGAALHRPAALPAPALALRLVLGAFAETLVGGQLILPTAAEDAGFRWRHPNLERALHAIVRGTSQTNVLRTYARTQRVAAPLERVFDFVADPKHLEAIAPPSLCFSTPEMPPRMSRGAQAVHRLRLHGIGIRWKTMIALWDPPNGFVDVQLHGPYPLWRHAHAFWPADGGTQIDDEVQYVLPLAPFGTIAAPLVERDIRSIFDFRHDAIARRFGSR